MASTHDKLIVGDDVLYAFMGGPRVLKSRSSNHGRLVAIKIRSPEFFCRTEYDMMLHASKCEKAMVPAVYGCYSVIRVKDDVPQSPWTVLTSAAVNGIRLDEAWASMNDEQRGNFREDLKAQLKTFRTMSQPYIGRVRHQHTRNIFDIVRTTYMGPFETEAKFDDWCLSRIHNSTTKRLFTFLLSATRKNGPYVLSHLDLRPWNILVDPTTYKLNGIVDFENSGFFPDYMEYAAAMTLVEHPKWWLEVLKSSLLPCGWWRLQLVKSMVSMR
jgi:Phosphotransferase enzyme family